MNPSMYAIAVDAFVPMLGTLSKLLDKGMEYANRRKFDPAVLVQGRLAPDMFPLLKHVQVACDNAEEAVARLSGKEPPPRRFHVVTTYAILRHNGVDLGIADYGGQAGRYIRKRS